MSDEHGDSYPRLREVLGDEGFAELAHLIRRTYEANEERRRRESRSSGEAGSSDAQRSEEMPTGLDG